MATAASSATHLLFAALATPRNRGRIHRRLGRLGGRGTEAEEAAAIAALVGGSDPDAALERAAKLLRCLPASRLHAADLADNMAAPPAGPTLHARTEPAAMGEVTAFLSHSWSDERGGARRQARAGVALGEAAPGGDRQRADTLAGGARPHSHTPSPRTRCTHAMKSYAPSPHRTRRASTRATSSSRSPACPSSSRAARRCSSWPGPRTAHGCGASWSSSRSLGVSACCTYSNLARPLPTRRSSLRFLDRATTRITIESLSQRASYSVLVRVCHSGRRPRACRDPSHRPPGR